MSADKRGPIICRGRRSGLTGTPKPASAAQWSGLSCFRVGVLYSRPVRWWISWRYRRQWAEGQRVEKAKRLDLVRLARMKIDPPLFWLDESKWLVHEFPKRPPGRPKIYRTHFKIYAGFEAPLSLLKRIKIPKGGM